MSHIEQCLDQYSLLIIEDDADTAFLHAFVLRASGATVTTAASAQEALKTLQNFTPDAILCDVFLPDMNGVALLNQIRTSQNNLWKNLPAIAVTGRGTRQNTAWALAAGFQGCLLKPIDPEALVAAVLTLLQPQLQNIAG